MKAIYKKELKGYFTSFIGYAFIAFFLIIIGIYFSAYNIMNSYANFEYTLRSVSFIFFILTPVITMRVMAEERHQKTDQLFCYNHRIFNRNRGNMLLSSDYEGVWKCQPWYGLCHNLRIYA